MKSNQILTRPTPRRSSRTRSGSDILPSGISGEALDWAYGELDAQYAREGRIDLFFNGLVKARRYLRKWPAPYQYPEQPEWFVGDLDENTAARKQGFNLVGYDCRPDSNECACRHIHPWKRGLKLQTCQHIQIVRLYQKAKSYESVRRERSA